MSDNVKDAEYFLAHPDEIPADFTSLGAQLGLDDAVPEQDEDSATSGAEPAADTKNPEDQPKPEDTPKDDPKPEAQQQQATETDNAPVLTKDGKHVLPYAVLATERERRQAAETALAALQQQVASGDKPASAATTEAIAELDQDTLKQIRDDFPAIGTVIDSLIAQNTGLAKQLSAVQERAQQREQTEAAVVQRSVDEVIESIPKLYYLQQKDPTLFTKAVEIDNHLKTLPKYASMSLSDRFEKVVAELEDNFGEIALPDEFKPQTVKTPDPKPDAAPKKDAVDPALKAKEIVEKAGKATPASLSDMPGGALPEASEADTLANLSSAQLAAKMDSMSIQQINALLARLG